MKKLNKLLFVAERDIDLLLLEEINVNSDFSSWLFRLTMPQCLDMPACTGAWHSVIHPQLGESDIVVKYANGHAILIENKVDAPAQPDQAARYGKRGAEGCDKGLWQSFVTCIVAPSSYVTTNAEAQNYDVRISYEQLQDWFSNEKTQRAEYRAYILSEAIEQNRRGYSPVANEDVTQFWLSYWDIANREFPALEMQRPGIKPANSDWPDFRPNQLGKNINIVHKMAQGYVDLQIRGASEKIEQIRTMMNGRNLDVVTAGRSTAIRVVVAPVNRFGSFDGQRQEIMHALDAAAMLLQIAKDMRDGI
ncbi:PD-(D/E)XK nuclease family protein [Simplicispira psychrophila]|uniref:PD-(D/E)XK nuclease family protein n=1 Tax=Simplicispira psychrophila TaxID=80882 RepID=UPI000484CCCA|nr:PD-(D/E)XK nuclease family protein [Simplicispira psychrophila]